MSHQRRGKLLIGSVLLVLSVVLFWGPIYVEALVNAHWNSWLFLEDVGNDLSVLRESIGSQCFVESHWSLFCSLSHEGYWLCPLPADPIVSYRAVGRYGIWKSISDRSVLSMWQEWAIGGKLSVGACWRLWGCMSGFWTSFENDWSLNFTIAVIANMSIFNF